MNFQNLMHTAVRSLSRNKMRSALTSLGVIIGVASVIMMVGIGNSARVAVREKIFTYGSNAMGLESKKKSFTVKDIDDIKRAVSSIKYISPMVGRAIVNTKYQGVLLQSRIRGVNNDFFRIKEWPLLLGRYFTDIEILSREKVVVIGNTVRVELFGAVNPIGKVIQVNNIPFQVIGCLAEQGQAFSGRDQDNVLVMPYTTASVKIVGRNDFNEIFIASFNERMVEKTENEVRSFIRTDRGLAAGVPDDFTITTSKEQLQMAEYISQTLAMLLAGIASISLVVGGIGIMNIMLVSVSERTREIGIRMAIGAKKRDILVQFLIEAVTLSSGGGIVGILIGLGVYYAIALGVGWEFLFSTFSVLVAFLFSCAVGIFFGYYPASKASKLKPIDALRYE
ncbi:MAG: FtsX-like permease family protein [Spirochaetes bacterium]|nr:MAG: FtsX-like permease family protein [Spirochaetota bacterium]